MKHIKIVIVVFMLFMCLVSMVAAEDVLLYSKPAYHGRLLDAETKQPIESAVVVALYWEELWFCINPGGCNGWIINAEETLTDKNGDFHIKPYRTLIQPFGYMGNTDFIIYKSGYASYPQEVQTNILKPLDYCSPQGLEKFFSGGIGVKGELELPFWHPKAFGFSRKVPITYGIVEMPKLKNRDDRLKALPSFPLEYDEKGLPILYEQIKSDRKFLFNEQ